MLPTGCGAISALAGLTTRLVTREVVRRRTTCRWSRTLGSVVTKKDEEPASPLLRRIVPSGIVWPATRVAGVGDSTWMVAAQVSRRIRP